MYREIVWTMNIQSTSRQRQGHRVIRMHFLLFQMTQNIWDRREKQRSRCNLEIASSHVIYSTSEHQKN